VKQKIACGCVMLSVCGAAPAWAQSWVAGPARPQASAGMSGALLPSGALWTVGGDGGGSTTENAYILEGGAWRAAAELSVSRTAASATVLPSGEVLVVGGRVESGGVGSPLVSTSAVELYDSMQDLVSAVAPLSAARDEHTATRLLDGRVMIIGGRTRHGRGRRARRRGLGQHTLLRSGDACLEPRAQPPDGATQSRDAAARERSALGDLRSRRRWVHGEHRRAL
jgi:hypothetical protein